MYWYAMNPKEKRICSTEEYAGLFRPDALDRTAGRMRPWFRVAQITDRVNTGPAGQVNF